MPPQPQGASLHGWISAVWFGSVGGDEFDFGWGADPQTPEIVYFCVFSTIYTIYLTLGGVVPIYHFNFPSFIVPHPIQVPGRCVHAQSSRICNGSPMINLP